jgi:OOP family OmpA-OmpF porin
MWARFGIAISLALSSAMARPAVAQSPSVTDLSNVDAEIIESGDIVEALAVPRGTKVRAGSRPRVRLPVYFEFNSADLKPEASTLLRKVGKALTATDLESFSFSVEGHTDNVGAENFNADLSKRRADAVRRFLEHAGVAPERLRAVGRGESDPLDSNSTERGREHNRRVEIINLGVES